MGYGISIGCGVALIGLAVNGTVTPGYGWFGLALVIVGAVLGWMDVG